MELKLCKKNKPFVIKKSNLQLVLLYGALCLTKVKKLCRLLRQTLRSFLRLAVARTRSCMMDIFAC